MRQQSSKGSWRSCENAACSFNKMKCINECSVYCCCADQPLQAICFLYWKVLPANTAHSPKKQQVAALFARLLLSQYLQLQFSLLGCDTTFLRSSLHFFQPALLALHSTDNFSYKITVHSWDTTISCEYNSSTVRRDRRKEFAGIPKGVVIQSTSPAWCYTATAVCHAECNTPAASRAAFASTCGHVAGAVIFSASGLFPLSYHHSLTCATTLEQRLRRWKQT